MSIRVFCDSCNKEIEKKEGFGQLNVWKKMLFFNANKEGNPSVPQIQEQEFYLCADCCEKVLELFKKEETTRSK